MRVAEWKRALQPQLSTSQGVTELQTCDCWQSENKACKTLRLFGSIHILYIDGCGR